MYQKLPWQPEQQKILNTGKVFESSIAFIICDRGKPLFENLSITLFKALSVISSAAVYIIILQTTLIFCHKLVVSFHKL